MISRKFAENNINSPGCRSAPLFAMNKIYITDSKHSLYPVFKELYSISFPIFEQRTPLQQELAFANPGYHLIGYEENGVFTGFISYWEFAGYVYIEHFAISRALRGNGFGSKIVQDFIASEKDKIVLLEIDPVIDEISAARLKFYQKSGFYENPYSHMHPPYRQGYEGHFLVILTTQRKITENEYQQFNKELTDVVMTFPFIPFIPFKPADGGNSNQHRYGYFAPAYGGELEQPL